MLPVEIWVIALVVAVVALSALAQRLSLPYPIVLVLGGAVLGFVPGLPAVHLEPELVLVVFLPPLLYNASAFANVGDFAENKKWLVLNTVPLVLLTMVLVAVVAHALVPDPRSRPPSPAPSRWGRRACGSCSASPSGWRSAGWPPECAAGSRTRS